MEILTVSGTEVTALFTVHYINGTEKTNTLTWDIVTGSNLWIIPSNLNEEDSFRDWAIEETLIGFYEEGRRALNHIICEESFDGYTRVFDGYWDKYTGILTEIYMDISLPDETIYVNYRAIETNALTPIQLQVILYLSASTINQEDSVTLSAIVKDDTGNPVEGATVYATINSEIIYLLDNGNGNYQEKNICL